jgi:hypothetical protein
MFPRVAIPTYQRHDSISNKTLKFLSKEGYPPELIYLFVASEEEKILYEQSVHFYLYNQIIVGELGIVNQRNFITRFFDEGELIIEMDDDIENIYFMFSNFKHLIEYGMQLINTGSGGLFGVMPTDDKRCMILETTTHLAFIIGTFSLRKNHHSIILTQVLGEDYERSILYFMKYKRLYRYKGAGIKTKFMKNPGGLQDGHRLNNLEECVKYLCNTYPNAVKRRTKHGLPDLILNWRFKG